MKKITGFQRPRGVEIEKETQTPTYTKFIVQPFEHGFGTTVGNALRRVLLSSIMGAAITAVRIEGVVHEFETIDGVWEDVLNIILNLKNIPIKLKNKSKTVLRIRKKGPGEVLSGDIIESADAEIVDKNIHIATLDEEGELNIDMVVRKNFGYVPAEYNFDEELGVDYILVDSVHSPVKKVNFTIEPARVGFRTDYEKLILEVWTNGTLTPQDAVDEAAKILNTMFSIFIVKEGEKVLPIQAEGEIPLWDKIEILKKPVIELDLHERAKNCLKSANITYVYELVQKTEKELKEIKNFGNKSLVNVKEKLESYGLDIGLQLHPELLKKIQSEL